MRRLIAEKGSELMFDVVLAVKGMGLAKTTKFMATFKLWRLQFQVSARPIISSSEAAVTQLVDIRDKKEEYFVCLTLHGANRLIAKHIITIGILTTNTRRIGSAIYRSQQLHDIRI